MEVCLSMQQSVFSTPIITPALRFLSNCWLKLKGWQVHAQSLPAPPFIFIGAPHTSNWDFLLLMVAVFHLRMDIRWMGKHTLFPPFIGRVMLWFGGIPVNRTKAYKMVDKMVLMLEENPQTILCIPPEGTRGRVTQWKTGFYLIAEKAEVPILMAAIDAENKQLRIIGEFKPTGDLDQDMIAIRKHYQGFKGLNPENTSSSQ